MKERGIPTAGLPPRTYAANVVPAAASDTGALLLYHDVKQGETLASTAAYGIGSRHRKVEQAELLRSGRRDQTHHTPQPVERPKRPRTRAPQWAGTIRQVFPNANGVRRKPTDTVASVALHLREMQGTI